MRVVIFAFLFFFLMPAKQHALKITEIFYKGSAVIRSEERYLEIYNDGSNMVDLSSVSVRVPASGTSTTDLTLQRGDFQLRQPGIVTDTTILPAGGLAVVMTEDYRKYAQLMAFASNTVLVKPRNKAFSGWSWDNRLQQIGLLTNGMVAYSCGNCELDNAAGLVAEESLSLNGNRFVRTVLNPGAWSKTVLRSSRKIVSGSGSVQIVYDDPFGTNDSVPAGFVIPGVLTGEFTLARSGVGVWSGWFTPPALPHGTDVFFYAGSNSAVTRFQDSRPLSSDYRRILINELVSDPQTDYSGGGWSGRDGGGLVDETDEWLELVNVSDRTLAVSNWFLYYQSESGENVKRMSFRSNSGSPPAISVLNPSGYLVVTPENGIANNARIVLYDGHPWIDGRIVDEVEYGSDDLSGDGTGNNAPDGASVSRQDESVARIPNAVWDQNYRDVFRKGPATFCGFNLSPPLLWVRDCAGPMENPVYLVREDVTDAVWTVSVCNAIDEEDVLLTNCGIHFRGMITMTRGLPVKGDGVLSVQNGIRNRVRADCGGIALNAEYIWALAGWSLPARTPDLQSVVAYPNPAPAGRDITLVVGNLPESSDVFLTDPSGNIIFRQASVNTGLCEFHGVLKTGIYMVAVRKGPERVFRRVLVR